MSVFVPVPYCLDDCGFVVEPEVRQVDSSSSILLSQATSDIFHRTRTNNFTVCMEIQKTPNGQMLENVQLPKTEPGRNRI